MSKIVVPEEPQGQDTSIEIDVDRAKREATISSDSSSSAAATVATAPPATIMGSEEDPKEYDQLLKIFYRILISGSVLGGIVILLMLYWVFNFGGGLDWNDATGGGSVNIHVLIMLFFMVYLHGHASLIYRILPSQPKYTVKLMHAGLHLSACIASAVGLAAAVKSHNVKGDPHFYSLHSWLGIAALSCYYLQFLGGFCTFLVPVTPTNIRLLALPIHRFVGRSVFKLCICATLTGIMLKAIGSLGWPKYKLLPPDAMVLNFSGIFVALFAIVIAYVLSDHRFRRRPRPGPEGELLLNPGRRTVGGGETDQSDQAE